MQININKKTIIIALIVLAVAVYLLWKRGTFSKVTGSFGSEDAHVDDPTSLDYILEHINFTSAERAKIVALSKACEADAARKQRMQDKAIEKGHSYDQQIVLDAIWLLYHSDSGWIDDAGSASDYGWKLQQKVLQLAGQSLW